MFRPLGIFCILEYNIAAAGAVDREFVYIFCDVLILGGRKWARGGPGGV